ncbi:MAG: sterol desaturase family protein [Acaryochloridaceae cyanobacterium SU_2_1]|nr:sterol desaturase family protein [Acaryochloridaceae cyanobacterium SU_2_1]
MQPVPQDQSIRRDIKLSMLSGVVFALCAALVMSAYDLDITLLYSIWHEYGLWYIGYSYAVVLVLQDAYFYGIHRLLHRPLLFKWLHKGHHRSGDPTPWTSFAFDPLEALVHSLFLVGVIFIIPLHFVTLIAVLMTMTVWAVVNHMGLDHLPVGFPHHWLGKWMIGPAHHSIHHRKYTTHYGLYFTIWDKLCSTQDPNYEKQFGAALHKELMG